MTKRKHRWPALAHASYTGSAPAFEPTDAEWETIGGDYCQLSQDDKEVISRAVTQYFRDMPFETNVHPHSELTGRLDTIREAALSLYQALNPRDEIGSIALELVAARISRSPEDVMGRVADIMVAAANEKREQNEDPTPGIQVHDYWRRLAREMMDWAEGRGKRVSTAKQNPAYSNWPSPFVQFFDRLQEAFPDEFRDFKTKAALTDALDDVRKSRVNKR
jgi:hypothetical protein